MEVHPRSRGEYVTSASPPSCTVGSPPLTRGIRGKIQQTQRSTRFTPAHAGNTLRKQKCPCHHRVHPRSRGEYFYVLILYQSLIGSPPLTRGILAEGKAQISDNRFTPAHAGNTVRTACYIFIRKGSPPLTRGILSVLQLHFSKMGFTPAHAGNTELYWPFPIPGSVHPRSRWEYNGRTCWKIRHRGSPPLTRGIRGEGFLRIHSGGFTPAHAGNTSQCSTQAMKYRVHPRSRGEYTKKSLILSHFFQHPFSHFI